MENEFLFSAETAKMQAMALLLRIGFVNSAIRQKSYSVIKSQLYLRQNSILMKQWKAVSK